jgi:hypothetical protein
MRTMQTNGPPMSAKHGKSLMDEDANRAMLNLIRSNILETIAQVCSQLQVVRGMYSICLG